MAGEIDKIMEALKKSEERFIKSISEIYGSLSNLKNDVELLGDKEPEVFSKIQKTAISLRALIQTKKKAIGTSIIEISKDDPLGDQKREMWKELLGEVRRQELEISELSQAIDIEAYSRKNPVSQLFSTDPSKVTSQDEGQVKQFKEIQANTDGLVKQFNKFMKENKDFEKSKYFGMQKNKMGFDDLVTANDQIGAYLNQHRIELEKILNIVGPLTDEGTEAIRKRISDQIDRGETPNLHFSDKEGNKIPGQYLDVIATLNNMAAGINPFREELNKRITAAKNKNDQLKRMMSIVNSSNKVRAQEITNKIKSDLKVQRKKFFIEHTGNASALTTSRLLHSPLTPEEAVKLRRKREFFDEMRVQQAICNELGEGEDKNYNVGDNIIALSKMGALKAEQFSTAVSAGVTEVIDELGSQALHAMDMVFSAPLAIVVKTINTGFRIGRAVFGAVGAYGFEAPRDYIKDNVIDKIRDNWNKDSREFGKLGGWEKAGKFFKWAGLATVGIPAAIGTAVVLAPGALCRAASKICEFVSKAFDYDRWVKKERDFTTFAGFFGGSLLYAGAIACVILAPFTLGLSLIPLVGLGVGIGVSSVHSARRAAENAAKAVTEVRTLELSPEDSIRLALYDKDNPNSGEEKLSDEERKAISEERSVSNSNESALTSSKAAQMGVEGVSTTALVARQDTSSDDLTKHAGVVVAAATDIFSAKRSQEERVQHLNDGGSDPLTPQAHAEAQVASREAEKKRGVDAESVQHTTLNRPTG